MITAHEDTKPLQDVPELIPARMLNEFAYCPRLAYLEWVQGEFADNLETLEGRFGHRRTERPSREEVPEPDAEADVPEEEPHIIHTRSLMLSAPLEGLVAKMDLVDLSAAEAVPVDYKRGRVPDVPGQAYEPEQVQLCAQGLVLRENGYHCEGGILYFIESRRRVSIPFDEPLVARTRELLVQLRAVAAAGVIPPPLDDSPKCPRCSLVGICLPDETRLLAKPDAERDVRRLIPARDDALPLYVQEQGASLGKSGEVLVVRAKQKVLQEVKLIDVSQVSLFGNVQLSAQALREITAAGIPICHFSYGGWFHALTTGLIHKNIELRIAQHRVADDPQRSLALARQFVVGKIKNCRTMLRRHLGDRAVGELAQLADFAQKAAKTSEAASLLGIEGMAAKVYFSG
jgi:CRISPR-associated protein Cas1